MNKETYGEIYLILQKMGKKYIDKIPRGIYNEIIYNMPQHMDNNKSISKDAIAFVAGMLAEISALSGKSYENKINYEIIIKKVRFSGV